jgi:phospholipid/cholesterol/gamma-HCH transport system permease protein
MKMRLFRKSFLVLGEFALFVAATFRGLRRIWRRRGLFIKQCEFIGVHSLGILFFAAAFMGAALGYQLYMSFKLFGAQALMGGSVGVALFRELGPVLAAIMVTGRAGAAMAAEIGSMRVTEQIDALEVMAVDPHEYLVTPRVLAAFTMVPICCFFFSGVASLASSFIACNVMGLSRPVFWTQYALWVDGLDMIHCALKGAAFGLALSLIGCFFGFRAYGGAGSVGFATRATVVMSCLSILFLDYLLTALLPIRWSALKVV